MMRQNNSLLKIIVPFLISLGIIGLISLGSTYYLQQKHIDELTESTFNKSIRLLDDSVAKTVQYNLQILSLLQHDSEMVSLYKNGDRNGIFVKLYPLYRDLNDKYGITHLYIHDLNRTNFVRIHNRAMFGDEIHRQSLINTVRTAAPSYGIEYSMSHNLTLRTVSPWIADDEIIGYIELGKEIERFASELGPVLGSHYVFTMKKDILDSKDRKRLEHYFSANKGYIDLGHYFTMERQLKGFEPLGELRSLLDRSDNVFNVEVNLGSKRFYVYSRSLMGTDNTEIGKVFVLIDVTGEVRELNSLLLHSGILILIVFFLLTLYYYEYIHVLDSRLQGYLSTIEFNARFEHYINLITHHLLDHPDIDKAFSLTLSQLGKALDADRTYIFTFKFDNSLMDNTHEWCYTGIRPQIDKLQDIPTKSIQWWLRRCLEHQSIELNTLDDLPAEARMERASLEEQEIRSLLVYPIVIGQKVYGFIGVDMVRHAVVWNDTQRSFVRITAEAIANTLDKKNKERSIERALENVTLTLESAINAILVVDELGNIEMYNQAFSMMWSIERSESDSVPFESYLEAMTPQIIDPDKFTERILTADNQNQHTFLLYLKDGRVIETGLVARMKENRNRGISFSFKDITRRLNIERELELSAKVFEHSLEGIVITDAQTRIVKANQSFVRLTGYDLSELVGQTPKMLQSHWHDDRFYRDMWRGLVQNGLWEGEIRDRRKNGELYITMSTIIAIRDEKGEIVNYIAISRDVTHIKEYQEKIETLAFYDSLTNLPNRLLFYDRLEQAIVQSRREQMKTALLFIDLDDFKTVNDTYGHRMGDGLLQRVAALLLESVRESDTVSRLGGDEFTIILKSVHTRDDIDLIGRDIIRKLSSALEIDGVMLLIGCSIGVAVFPEDAGERNTLIQKADEAMYRAKSGGKNRIAYA